jgi:malonate-semialdehyde dehydrogenase (acetylating) / methylmalonate-semialdehyde dehydrogenase
MEVSRVSNYIGGVWLESQAAAYLPALNPATGETLGQVPLSTASDVNSAVQAAARAFPEWRQTPPTERVQYLFKLKRLLEENLDGLARTLTNECGKTFQESLEELRRGVQAVEVACGIPLSMQGYNSEDIARGIDESMIRQPLGVVAAITPFNFPGMIPLWFLPFAIACGNTFILKPSEKVPLTAGKLMEVLERTGLPPGVVNLVNGSQEAVEAILDHPQVRAISFVGSTPVAKHVYARAAFNGKRAQCQGGAKNPVILLEDADVEFATRTLADSAFGCAGQRCLAASVAVTVGEARRRFTEALVGAAKSRVVGYGLNPDVQMGPVISRASQVRIEGLVGTALREGAEALAGGGLVRVAGFEDGNFFPPTVLTGVNPGGALARTEIFGPVLSLVAVESLDEAIRLVNKLSYGNMACLFTNSGAAARKFRHEVQAGNIGINVGVAAPMAFFPFSGWKESFFGDLHGQGRDAIDFYTEKKVVVERWPAY